jgi:2-polyprenyl-3-methyl-5-hydroxy-6-metoxy-1,4-benzoquinol methylase
MNTKSILPAAGYSEAFQSALAEYVTGDAADRGEQFNTEIYVKVGYADSFFDFARRYVELEGKRFIEVGCGHGHVSVAAANHGAKVTATDFVPKALELTRMRLAEHGYEAHTFASDLRDELPADHHGAFDFVWCFQVLEHIPREGQFKALANLIRMVAPGGYLFIDTENALCPYDRHDTHTWLVRLMSPEPQARIISALGAGINSREASFGGEVVQIHDYLTYDEIIGAAKVNGFEVVCPFMPHGDQRQYLRMVTGSDWLHEAILKHFPIERFSPVSLLLRRQG